MIWQLSKHMNKKMEQWIKVISAGLESSKQQIATSASAHVSHLPLVPMQHGRPLMLQSMCL